MSIFVPRSLCSLLVCLIGVSGPMVAAAGQSGTTVEVPAGIHHADYDRLLKRYVDARGLVDYAGWKKNAKDLESLDRYLKQFARPGKPARGAERAASLINAYNAFVLHWILKNFPVESIWRTDHPFRMDRYEVSGKKVSLDQIEKESLIPLIGWKAHAVLVCAARSCPPLQRYAYRKDRVEAQIAHAYRVWLSRGDFNDYLPEKNRVEISRIFKWYAADFTTVEGGVRGVLEEYGPTEFKKFLGGSDYAIKYRAYDWGLNDQGSEGKGYSRIELLWDNLF